jgi:hypothetical protein
MTDNLNRVCKHCRVAISEVRGIWVDDIGDNYCGRAKTASARTHEPVAEASSSRYESENTPHRVDPARVREVVEASSSGAALLLQELRERLACDACGREKYFSTDKRWLHSHSNIEMCDDKDCKKFEAIYAKRPSAEPLAELKGPRCPKCGIEISAHRCPERPTEASASRVLRSMHPVCP